MKSALLKNRTVDHGQSQVFYLLHDFALRICIRYTGTEDDPENLLYQGFAKLFREWQHLKSKSSTFLKNRLRDLLISGCIELETQKGKFYESFWDHSTISDESVTSISLTGLSDKKLIEVLRTVPFSFRAVYNMAVIDGFNEGEISSRLKVSEELVKSCLKLARKQLAALLNDAMTPADNLVNVTVTAKQR